MSRIDQDSIRLSGQREVNLSITPDAPLALANSPFGASADILGRWLRLAYNGHSPQSPQRNLSSALTEIEELTQQLALRQKNPVTQKDTPVIFNDFTIEDRMKKIDGILNRIGSLGQEGATFPDNHHVIYQAFLTILQNLKQIIQKRPDYWGLQLYARSIAHSLSPYVNELHLQLRGPLNDIYELTKNAPAYISLETPKRTGIRPTINKRKLLSGNEIYRKELSRQLFSFSRGNIYIEKEILKDLHTLAFGKDATDESRQTVVLLLREFIQLTNESDTIIDGIPTFLADDALTVRDFSKVVGLDRPLYLLSTSSLFPSDNWTNFTAQGLRQKIESDKDQLARKSVLELGTGTGLLPIYVGLTSQASRIESYDLNPDTSLVAPLNLLLAYADDEGRSNWDALQKRFHFGHTTNLHEDIDPAKKFDWVFACIPQVPSKTKYVSDRDKADVFIPQGYYAEDKDGLGLLARLLSPNPEAISHPLHEHLNPNATVQLIISGRPGLLAIEKMARIRGWNMGVIRETTFRQHPTTDLSGYVDIEDQGLRPEFEFISDGKIISARTAQEILGRVNKEVSRASSFKQRKAILNNPKNQVQHRQFIVEFSPVTSSLPNWNVAAQKHLQDHVRSTGRIPYNFDVGSELDEYRDILHQDLQAFLGTGLPKESLFTGPNTSRLILNLAHALLKEGASIDIASSTDRLKNLKNQLSKSFDIHATQSAASLHIIDLDDPAVDLQDILNLAAKEKVVVLANPRHANTLHLLGEKIPYDKALLKNLSILWEDDVLLPADEGLSTLLVFNETVYGALKERALDTYSRLSLKQIVQSSVHSSRHLFSGVGPNFGDLPQRISMVAGDPSDIDLTPGDLEDPDNLRAFYYQSVIDQQLKRAPNESDHTSIDLSFGESEFPIPEKLRSAVVDGLTREATDEKVRKVIAKFITLRKGNIWNAQQVTLGYGVQDLVHATLQAIKEDTHEPFSVLMPQSHYGQFSSTIISQQIGLETFDAFSDTTNKAALRHTLEGVYRRAQDSGSPLKAILINYPTNPEGLYYSEEALTTLLDFAQEHDLIILADEVFLNTGDPDDQTHVFEFSKKKKYKDFIDTHVVGFTGLSKEFGWGGARLGAAFSRNSKLLATIERYASTTPPDKHALGLALTAYRKEFWKPYFQAHREWLTDRLDKLLDVLAPYDASNLIHYTTPEGGYFVEVDVHQMFGRFIPYKDKVLYIDEAGSNLHEVLHEMTGLIIHPVGWSGNPSSIRLIYSLENIDEALTRLDGFLHQVDQQVQNDRLNQLNRIFLKNFPNIDAKELMQHPLTSTIGLLNVVLLWEETPVKGIEIVTTIFNDDESDERKAQRLDRLSEDYHLDGFQKQIIKHVLALHHNLSGYDALALIPFFEDSIVDLTNLRAIKEKISSLQNASPTDAPKVEDLLQDNLPPIDSIMKSVRREFPYLDLEKIINHPITRAAQLNAEAIFDANTTKRLYHIRDTWDAEDRDVIASLWDSFISLDLPQDSPLLPSSLKWEYQSLRDPHARLAFFFAILHTDNLKQNLEDVLEAMRASRREASNPISGVSGAQLLRSSLKSAPEWHELSKKFPHLDLQSIQDHPLNRYKADLPPLGFLTPKQLIQFRNNPNKHFDQLLSDKKFSSLKHTFYQLSPLLNGYDKLMLFILLKEDRIAAEQTSFIEDELRKLAIQRAEKSAGNAITVSALLTASRKADDPHRLPLVDQTTRSKEEDQDNWLSEKYPNLSITALISSPFMDIAGGHSEALYNLDESLQAIRNHAPSAFMQLAVDIELAIENHPHKEKFDGFREHFNALDAHDQLFLLLASQKGFIRAGNIEQIYQTAKKLHVQKSHDDLTLTEVLSPLHIQYTRSRFGDIRVVTSVDEFLNGADPSKPKEVLNQLTGPTVLHLDAGQQTTRVVSVLVHGNEPSGFLALIKLLPMLKNPHVKPTTNLVFIIQNVQAAQAGNGFEYRFLPEVQTDLNRSFKDSPDQDPYTLKLMGLLQDIHQHAPIEAIIDVHNLSGNSPAHAVVMDKHAAFSNDKRRLASYLSPHTLEIPLQGSFMSQAEKMAPSVIIEVGKMGTQTANQEAMRVISRFIKAPASFVERLSDYNQPSHIRYRVSLARPDIPFGPSGLVLNERLDTDLNFKHTDAGYVLAQWSGDHLPLRVTDLYTNTDVTHQFLVLERGQIKTRVPLSATMATLNEKNIRQSELFSIYEQDWPQFLDANQFRNMMTTADGMIKTDQLYVHVLEDELHIESPLYNPQGDKIGEVSFTMAPSKENKGKWTVRSVDIELDQVGQAYGFELYTQLIRYLYQCDTIDSIHFSATKDAIYVGHHIDGVLLDEDSRKRIKNKLVSMNYEYHLGLDLSQIDRLRSPKDFVQAYDLGTTHPALLALAKTAFVHSYLDDQAILEQTRFPGRIALLLADNTDHSEDLRENHRSYSGTFIKDMLNVRYGAYLDSLIHYWETRQHKYPHRATVRLAELQKERDELNPGRATSYTPIRWPQFFDYRSFKAGLDFRDSTFKVDEMTAVRRGDDSRLIDISIPISSKGHNVATYTLTYEPRQVGQRLHYDVINIKRNTERAFLQSPELQEFELRLLISHFWNPQITSYKHPNGHVTAVSTEDPQDFARYLNLKKSFFERQDPHKYRRAIEIIDTQMATLKREIQARRHIIEKWPTFLNQGEFTQAFTTVDKSIYGQFEDSKFDATNNSYSITFKLKNKGGTDAGVMHMKFTPVEGAENKYAVTWNYIEVYQSGRAISLEINANLNRFFFHHPQITHRKNTAVANGRFTWKHLGGYTIDAPYIDEIRNTLKGWNRAFQWHFSESIIDGLSSPQDFLKFKDLGKPFAPLIEITQRAYADSPRGASNEGSRSRYPGEVALLLSRNHELNAPMYEMTLDLQKPERYIEFLESQIEFWKERQSKYPRAGKIIQWMEKEVESLRGPQPTPPDRTPKGPRPSASTETPPTRGTPHLRLVVPGDTPASTQIPLIESAATMVGDPLTLHPQLITEPAEELPPPAKETVYSHEYQLAIHERLLSLGLEHAQRWLGMHGLSPALNRDELALKLREQGLDALANQVESDRFSPEDRHAIQISLVASEPTGDTSELVALEQKPSSQDGPQQVTSPWVHATNGLGRSLWLERLGK